MEALIQKLGITKEEAKELSLKETRNQKVFRAESYKSQHYFDWKPYQQKYDDGYWDCHD